MADEEVTDLTEGEEDSDAKAKGKQKTEKAPKAAKEKKEKGSKDKKEKGEKGGSGVIILLMILVLVVLIGGFGAAVYFDILGAREIVADAITEPLLNLIVWLDPQFSTVDQQLRDERAAQERRFAEREADFEDREEEIILQEDILIMREQALDRREMELNNREDQIIAMYERTIPIHRREMTEQELEDMLSLSTTYTQMSPESAAAILVELYDPRDVAAILYYMGERNAGSILAVMRPNYAAEITEILLYS